MPRRWLAIGGLAFGDEGKGATVAFLAAREKADLVVRYNGGAQAGHNVVLQDGRHHAFSQFGSATFQRVPTYLSRYMLVDPLAMTVEAQTLASKGVKDPMGLVYIDERAPVITPYHRAVNRIREYSRGDARHGSCGLGIGECMDDLLAFGAGALRVGDLPNVEAIRAKLDLHRTRSWMKLNLHRTRGYRADGREEDYKLLRSPVEDWMGRYVEFAQQAQIVPPGFPRGHQTVIFEGAQGVLLDQDHGVSPPHITWSDCTFGNAERILEECGDGAEVTRIGVVRTYMTRHGAGPFPTWDPSMKPDPGEHNATGKWQGEFRLGPLDVSLLRYGLKVLGGVDEIAVTHVDTHPEGLATLEELGPHCRVASPAVGVPVGSP